MKQVSCALINPYNPIIGKGARRRTWTNPRKSCRYGELLPNGVICEERSLFARSNKMSNPNKFRRRWFRGQWKKEEKREHG
jgi:hypothetical protein